MKSAEEWTQIRNGMPMSLTWQDGPLLAAKEFADFVRMVQLDSWKQGMTDAAEIVIKFAVDVGRTPVNGIRHLIEDKRGNQDEVRKTYQQEIHRIRDNTPHP